MPLEEAVTLASLELCVTNPSRSEVFVDVKKYSWRHIFLNWRLFSNGLIKDKFFKLTRNLLAGFNPQKTCSFMSSRILVSYHPKSYLS